MNYSEKQMDELLSGTSSNTEPETANDHQFINNITESIFFDATEAKTDSGIAETIENILENVEKQVQQREHYVSKTRAHNQLELFNLQDHLQNFEIDEEMYEKLSFRECLMISKLEKDSGKDKEVSFQSVGGICIDVQQVKGKQPMKRVMEEYEEKLMHILDTDGYMDHIGAANFSENHVEEEEALHMQNSYGYSKFLVHISSQFDCEGDNAGSSITTFVDRCCHTLEELRKEFVIENDTNTVNEKTLYTALKHHWYYLKHTSLQENHQSKMLYSLQKAREYVSEGANIILMRYLAITRFCGKFELSCMYINGHMCRNIYQCYGPETDKIEGKSTKCCRIKRTIIEESGIRHECIAVLSLQGKLLKQEWNGCDYVIVINPLSDFGAIPERYATTSNIRENWANDLQLMSLYLDQRRRLILEAKSYDLDHPELRQALADYVNHILLLRPPDIKAFTHEYFGSFLTKRLPRNDFFE